MASSSFKDASIQSLIAPQSISASVLGSAVLLAGPSQQGAGLAVQIGVDSTGTGSTCSVQLQSSPDGNTWENVGDASAIATPSAAVLQWMPFMPNDQSGLRLRAQVVVGTGTAAAPTFPLSVALVSGIPLA